MPPLQLGRQRHESILNVSIVLCGSFHHEHDLWNILAHGLGFRKLHLTNGVQITLVSHDKDHHVGCGVAAHLVDPSLQVQKGGTFGDVVHNDNAICGSVVALGDGSESLLTSGIPNLKLDLFSIHGDCLHGKVHPDGVAVAFDKISGFEALNYAGLARSAISYQNNLEQEIEAFLIADHQRSWVASCGHRAQAGVIQQLTNRASADRRRSSLLLNVTKSLAKRVKIQNLQRYFTKLLHFVTICRS